MGTTYRVVVPVDRGTEFDKEQMASLIQEALDDVDARMSTWKPDSEVSRFNATQSTEPFSVSQDVLNVVVRAQEVAEATGGAFDITAGPLIDAWGFGSDDSELPSEEHLQQIAQRVGYQKLLVDAEASTLTKVHPALEINLSAIAKGYGVDRVADALLSTGVLDALIEVGGEVRALGRPQADLRWRVAIEQPDGSGATQRIIELEDQALATSGDYRNFRQLEDGSSVSHLLDPRRKRPMQHRGASVSVIAANCTSADAWATALFVLGPDESEGAIPGEVSALFVLHRPDGSYSESMLGAF